MRIPKLSVIIASANDPLLNDTVRSIRKTAGLKVEVVICDDCSANPVRCDEADLIVHNRHRCGVGPSRHIAATYARGEFILITDAHMVFLPAWYEILMSYLNETKDAVSNTLYCGTCLGLSKDNMDVTHPDATYQGATLKICGPDANAKGRSQVMEVIWNPATPEDNAQIPCVMGACYVTNRDWFLKLAPLRFLRGWGGDELMLSLSAWLCGGEVRYAKRFRVGHRFKSPNEKLFTTPIGYPTFNKLFAVYTLLDSVHQSPIVGAIKQTVPGVEWAAAEKLVRSEWPTITTESARYHSMFQMNFSGFCRRFGLRADDFGLSL